MLRKINTLLTVIISLFVGAFAGLAAGAYQHYKAFEDLYVEQSAPWYFHLIGYLAAMLVIVIICMALKMAVRRKVKEPRKPEKPGRTELPEENKPEE